MSCFLLISILDCFMMVAVMGRGPHELLSPQAKFSVSHEEPWGALKSHGDPWRVSLGPQISTQTKLRAPGGPVFLPCHAMSCHEYLFFYTCTCTFPQ